MGAAARKNTSVRVPGEENHQSGLPTFPFFSVEKKAHAEFPLLYSLDRCVTKEVFKFIPTVAVFSL